MTQPDPLTELIQQTRAGLDMIAWMDHADRENGAGIIENRSEIVENPQKDA